jgi:hypothetical protein
MCVPPGDQALQQPSVPAISANYDRLGTLARQLSSLGGCGAQQADEVGSALPLFPSHRPIAVVAFDPSGEPRRDVRDEA